MARRTSRSGTRAWHHSAYWYAYNYGYTYSEKSSYTMQYLDMHTYYPKGSGWHQHDLGTWGSIFLDDARFDSRFNLPFFGVAIAMDIGSAMYTIAKNLADPDYRAQLKDDLRHKMRILRRPLYYRQETERRRELARARRKLKRRTTTAPMPTAEKLLAAWNARKESKENMIRLGGMLQDLECYVDNCLRFDADGEVVGRNRGIRGWIAENLPELSGKYKTLMRYKAMAIKLRQATGTKDPTPTEKLLDEPRGEVVKGVLEDFRITFSSLEEGIRFWIDEGTVLRNRDEVRKRIERARRMIRKRQ